jgi:hypothetical protein
MSATRIDLRPPPVLAIGVVGHFGTGIEDENAKAVTAALDALLGEIDALFRKVVAAERPFFADAEPVLRLVGTAAEGSALQAARRVGAEIACIVPFAPDEHERDFSTPAARDVACTSVTAAPSVFVLPGKRDEGARAHERANNVVLANIDLLLAVWNGAPSDGRAGTGDVVQAAVSFGIPVIVIPIPVGEHAPPKLLLRPGDDQLEHPIASDLTGAPLESLPRLLREIVAPPTGADKRRGLADLYGEQPGRPPRRFEYSLLLKMFAVDRVRVRSVAAPSQASEPAPSPAIAELRLRTHVIDSFSVHYGRLFRSSNTSAFLLIIFAALFSATLMILFNVFGIWIFGQMLVTGLVLLDAGIGAKRRWHERWLDYRLLAERLRCLRFLQPLGLGLDRATGLAWRPKQSWVEWYVRRSERALGPPSGEMRPEHVAGAAQRLADIEIAGQIDYHRRAFRQFGLLEQRLAGVARVSLWATTAVAALLGIVAIVEWPFDPWRPLASLLLFALPAVTSAFAGVRAEADLVRLAERSAAAAVALARLRRVIGAGEPTYDRIAVAAMRAAAIMAAELSDWRFVLERRRARARRPALGTRRGAQ